MTVQQKMAYNIQLTNEECREMVEKILKTMTHIVLQHGSEIIDSKDSGHPSTVSVIPDSLRKKADNDSDKGEYYKDKCPGDREDRYNGNKGT